MLKYWQAEQEEHTWKLYEQQSVILDKLVAEIAELKLQNSSLTQQSVRRNENAY